MSLARSKARSLATATATASFGIASGRCPLPPGCDSLRVRVCVRVCAYVVCMLSPSLSACPLSTAPALAAAPLPLCVRLAFVQCVASCIGSVIQVFSDLLNAVRAACPLNQPQPPSLLAWLPATPCRD